MPRADGYKDLCIPEDVHGMLKSYSEEVGRPMTWILEEAVRRYLREVDGGAY